MTYERLRVASFTHSTIYAILLTVWILPGLHTAEFVFGLSHGLGWIAMCCASLVALRRGIIDLRHALAISVIGAVGPFVGSYEFIRRSAPGQRALRSPEAR